MDGIDTILRVYTLYVLFVLYLEDNLRHIYQKQNIKRNLTFYKFYNI